MTLSHIFIDFGSELNVDYKESTDTAMSKMIKTAECDAVLFSHYHGDHVGLMKEVPEKDVRGREIKLGMGRVARNVLINIHKTLSKSEKDDSIEHGKMLDLLNEADKLGYWFEIRCSACGESVTIEPISDDISYYWS